MTLSIGDLVEVTDDALGFGFHVGKIGVISKVFPSGDYGIVTNSGEIIYCVSYEVEMLI